MSLVHWMFFLHNQWSGDFDSRIDAGAGVLGLGPEPEHACRMPL